MIRFCIILLLVACFFSTTAKAVCVCSDTPGVRSAISEASAIFKGQVEEVIWLNPFDYIAKIHVLKSWKLIQEEDIWIASTTFDKECGVNFTVGYKYLIYAYNVTQHLLSASKCARTKQWQEVSDQEKRLLGKLVYNNEIE